MAQVDALWTKLTTEQPDKNYENLDTSTSLEIATMMNQADKAVPEAVAKSLPQIAKAIDLITERLKKGGRLFYTGAGTSGRLGILDAAECPPTFGTDPEFVQAIIAGGDKALYKAVEGAEDSFELGEEELKEHGLQSQDVVVGIAASGRTPYVIGALTYARASGAATISLACNAEAKISSIADVAIEVITGSEVLMGSTRLKAGTAQKLVLNMLSTGSMVKLGKIYRNLMVDLTASNEKLVERSKRIITFATGVSYDEAAQALMEANGHVKTAIVMIKRKVDALSAQNLLEQSEGFLRPIMEAKSDLNA